MMRLRAILRLQLLIVILMGMPLASGCGETAEAGAAETLNQAVEQFAEAESYHTQVGMNIEMNGDASEYDKDLARLLPMNLTLNGQMDMDTRKRDEIRMRMYDLNLGGFAEMMQKAAPSGGSSAQDALAAGMMSQMFKDMEMIMIKDTIYVKTAGVWMDMDLNDMPESEGADFSCLFEAGSSQSMSINQWGGGALKDVEELDGEELDGVKTRRFRASFDSEEAISDLDKSMESMEKCGFGQGALGVGEDGYPGIEDLKSMYRTIYDSFVLEFWVDEDLTVHRVGMDMEFDMGDVLKATGEEVPDGMGALTVKINATLDMSRFGEDFDITAPAKSIPFEELMDEMDGPSGVMGGQMT